MKVEKYRGHDIWLMPSGYYRAYSPEGAPLPYPRVSLEGIKKLIRDTMRASE